jgi:hypothetical protein
VSQSNSQRLLIHQPPAYPKIGREQHPMFDANDIAYVAQVPVRQRDMPGIGSS